MDANTHNKSELAWYGGGDDDPLELSSVDKSPSSTSAVATIGAASPTGASGGL
jgi:hypothetical protein